jgi:hypothetical protein
MHAWLCAKNPMMAQALEGNYVYIETSSTAAGEAWFSTIRRVSEEPIKGMQFDVTLPEGLEIDEGEMALTLEWTGFQLSTSNLGGNTYRILIFNFSGLTVPDGDVSVVEVSGFMSPDVMSGVYPVPMSEVVLSNANNTNVAEDPLEIGSIVVVSTECPADLDADGAVGTSDLLVFLSLFGCTEDCGLIDLNGDGAVGVGDLLDFLLVFESLCN